MFFWTAFYYSSFENSTLLARFFLRVSQEVSFLCWWKNNIYQGKKCFKATNFYATLSYIYSGNFEFYWCSCYIMKDATKGWRQLHNIFETLFFICLYISNFKSRNWKFAVTFYIYLFTFFGLFNNFS